MTYRIAFFDIDGTLVSFKTHAMSESTKRALDILRRNGIKIVISTGRSYTEMPVELRNGFDAYATKNGQRCFCGRELYRDVALDPSDVAVIVDQVREGRYDVLVTLGDREFVNALSPRAVKLSEQVKITYEVDDIQLALENPVYQFCVFVDPVDEQQFLCKMKASTTTRWTPLACDVVPIQGGKNYGVRATLDYFGLTPEEAIAFGDGDNDLSMLQAVGTGVAMGNAGDRLKAAADYVTDDVDSDGLWNACRHFGLV